ncbi:MAG: hypothetical protein E6G97_21905 [Alphaproteobacteria bacterium]|nr:MAG: hypothetical protein E6G97_21905 [Alphaproteobacteria bacterium]
MHDILTETERSFLDRHGYRPDDVFDARGYSQAGWKRRAKEAGKDIVLGSPCRAEGHRLRTRGGHCFQCDPKKIAWVQRETARGQVYIAGSLDGRLIKIGCCFDWEQRLKQECAERYGGHGDWRLLAYITIENIQTVERAALSKLWRYQVTRPYWKDGSRQYAEELLTCSYSQAAEALFGSAEGSGADYVSGRTADYEFEPVDQHELSEQLSA